MFAKSIESHVFKKTLKECVRNVEALERSPNYLLQAAPFVYTEKLLLPLLCLYENSSGLEKIFLFFLLESYYGAEKICGDSGKVSLLLALEISRELMKNYDNITYNEEKLLQETEEIRSALRRLSLPPMLRDVKKLISEISHDDFVTDIFLEVLRFGGLTGKIFLEESRYNYSSVELTQGYTFEIEVPPSFFRKDNAWRRSWPSCLVVDGVINEVSEIHHLLENFSHDKKSLAIFARNYSKDVLSTLKVNFDRETLDVIPFVLPDKLECINNLVDISKVAGSSLITPTKGDIISTMDYSELVTVEDISYQDGNITILNTRTQPAVNSHKQMLENRRQKEIEPEIVRILSIRLRSLTSLCTIVRLSQKDAHKNEEIDYLLRAIQAILGSGYIRTRDVVGYLQQHTDTLLSKVLQSVLSSENRSIYPAASVARSVTVGGSTMLALMTSATAVILDE